MKIELITKMLCDDCKKIERDINIDYSIKVERSLKKMSKIPSFLMGGNDSKTVAISRLEMFLSVNPIRIEKCTPNGSFSELIIDVGDFLFENKAMKVMGINEDKLLYEMMDSFNALEGKIIKEEVKNV